MNDLKKQFIEFILEHEILRFGNFTLNSGRESPYFFNTGLCNSGKLLAKLAEFYCHYIIQNKLAFDYVFGPAYKGITLASSISNMLYMIYDIDKPYSFNRKEAKSHGESGIFVGFQPKGKSLVVDDVISSGESIDKALSLLNQSNSSANHVLVAFDRMEVGTKISAKKELSDKWGIELLSIIDLEDIVNYLQVGDKYSAALKDMTVYLKKYKA
tara:strand:- start:496 stop:1134 length:639 start_codon:yes stop_codon:yes gene_type:complete